MQYPEDDIEGFLLNQCSLYELIDIVLERRDEDFELHRDIVSQLVYDYTDFQLAEILVKLGFDLKVIVDCLLEESEV